MIEVVAQSCKMHIARQPGRIWRQECVVCGRLAYLPTEKPLSIACPGPSLNPLHQLEIRRKALQPSGTGPPPPRTKARRHEVKQAREKPTKDCKHFGKWTRTTPCQSCGGSVRIKVFACGVYGECVKNNGAEGLPICGTICPSYEARS